MSKPDYIVKVKARDAKYGTRVGAAWLTRSGGGINIRLDAGIALVGAEGIDVTLWPYEEREGGSRGGGGGRGGDDFGGAAGNFDDIPFAPRDSKVF